VAAIPGSVRVTGFIAPTDSNDTYPTHSEEYNKGGFRSVADTTERDAIPASRRSNGMVVRCVSNAKYYTLAGGLTNAYWEETKISPIVPAYTVEVAKSGRDFTSIQAAINSITVSGGHRWTVLVHPGDYAENVELRSSIDLVGVDRGTTRITPTSGTGIYCGNPYTGTSNVTNVTVYMNTGSNACDLCTMSRGTHTFTNCQFIGVHDRINTSMVRNLSTGMLRFEGCYFSVTAGSSMGSAYFARRQNGGGMVFNNCRISIDSQHTAGKVYHILDSTGTGHGLTVENSEISFSSGGDGDVVLLTTATDSTADTVLRGSRFSVSSSSASGEFTALHIASGTGHVVSSHGNTYVVGSFNSGANESFATDDGTSCLIDSRFDTIEFTDIDSLYDISSGNVEFVTSPNPGEIQISRTVVPRVIQVTSDYDDGESWRFDIAEVDTSSNDVSFTFPGSISGFPLGSRLFLFNNGDGLVYVDGNGTSIDSSTDGRVIYPNGYVELERIGSGVRVIDALYWGFDVQPGDIANLELWFEPFDPPTVTLTGTLVDQIDDKSLNSWDLTGTGATRPNIEADGINTGKNSITFAATHLLTAGNHQIHDNTRGLYVVALVKPTDTGDYIVSKFSSGQREWYMGTTRCRVYQEIDGSPRSSVTAYPPRPEWSLLEMKWSPGTGVSVYIDGGLQGVGAAITSIQSGTAEVILGDASGLAGYLGEVGFLAAYSRSLSYTEQRYVREYVWGVLGLTGGSGGYGSQVWDRDEGTGIITPSIDGDDLDMGDGYVSAGSVRLPVMPKSAGYTIQPGDAVYTLSCDASGGASTIVLPLASASTGRVLNVIKTDSSINVVTVTGYSTETINGVASHQLQVQWDSLQVHCDGTTWYII